MKKFTKIILIIAGSLAALGIVFSGIAAVMGAGWSTIHRKALAGEFDFGNWHIGNGVYYAYDQGHGILDHFWDDDYDDDDDDYEDEYRRRREERKSRNKKKHKAPNSALTILSLVAGAVILVIAIFFIGKAAGIIGGETPTDNQQEQNGQRRREKPSLLPEPDRHAVSDAHVPARRQQDGQQISRPESRHRRKGKQQRPAGQHRRQHPEHPSAVRRTLRLAQVHPLFYF